MFTGIIEELGSLLAFQSGPDDSARIAVRGALATSDAKLGDSIAVNGVCLTVTELAGDCFEADVMRETLVHTTLGSLPAGASVNLERAVRGDGRLGGHIVSGHVDSVGHVVGREPAARWEVVRIGVDAAAGAQIAVKGSVAVDGVSLTVTAVDEGAGAPVDQSGGDGLGHWFEVSLIPATLADTTLGSRPVGAAVNIETDVLAKYVQRLLIGPRP